MPKTLSRRSTRHLQIRGRRLLLEIVDTLEAHGLSQDEYQLHIFFVLVVTQIHKDGPETTVTLDRFSYATDPIYGPFSAMLGVEMFVTLLTMAPVAKAAECVGLNLLSSLGSPPTCASRSYRSIHYRRNSMFRG